MSYFSQQLPSGHYGIYINNKLAAYINCPETCQKLVKGLKEKFLEAHGVGAAKEQNIVRSSLDITVAS